jgi:hypothetical protein
MSLSRRRQVNSLFGDNRCRSQPPGLPVNPRIAGAKYRLDNR